MKSTIAFYIVCGILLVSRIERNNAAQISIFNNGQLNENNAISQHISPSIINDVKDFFDLIPKAFIDEVIAEHFLFDTEFRKALEFVESSNFKQLIDKVQKLPEVLDMLNYLHILVPDIEDIDLNRAADLDVPFLEIVLLESMKHENRQTLLTDEKQQLIDSKNLQSFTSVVNELLGHLPQDKFANRIKEKCDKSSEFLTFYTALRSNQFKSKVESLLKSSSLSSFVKTLKANYVNPDDLVPIMFKVISWGPSV